MVVAPLEAVFGDGIYTTVSQTEPTPREPLEQNRVYLLVRSGYSGNFGSRDVPYSASLLLLLVVEVKAAEM